MVGCCSRCNTLHLGSYTLFELGLRDRGQLGIADDVFIDMEQIRQFFDATADKQGLVL